MNTLRKRVRSLLPTRADLTVMGRAPRGDLLAGLTVAVVAGALATVFGGSNLQVSGPTGAMTVVLVPIVAQYGASGVLTVGLAAARAGRYPAPARTAAPTRPARPPSPRSAPPPPSGASSGSMGAGVLARARSTTSYSTVSRVGSVPHSRAGSSTARRGTGFFPFGYRSHEERL